MSLGSPLQTVLQVLKYSSAACALQLPGMRKGSVDISATSRREKYRNKVESWRWSMGTIFVVRRDIGRSGSGAVGRQNRDGFEGGGLDWLGRRHAERGSGLDDNVGEVCGSAQAAVLIGKRCF